MARLTFAEEERASSWRMLATCFPPRRRSPLSEARASGSFRLTRKYTQMLRSACKLPYQIIQGDAGDATG
jgi:hypothetical protein